MTGNTLNRFEYLFRDIRCSAGTDIDHQPCVNIQVTGVVANMVSNNIRERGQDTVSTFIAAVNCQYPREEPRE
jgi:hypothetical protein